MLSTGIARGRQMVATASRGVSAECIASPSPSFHAQETTRYSSASPALTVIRPSSVSRSTRDTQVPQCLTPFVLGAHYLREAVALEVPHDHAQPVVFDDGVRLE